MDKVRKIQYEEVHYLRGTLIKLRNATMVDATEVVSNNNHTLQPLVKIELIQFDKEFQARDSAQTTKAFHAYPNIFCRYALTQTACERESPCTPEQAK